MGPRTRGGPTTLSVNDEFESATFEAKINEVKFMPSGELRIVLLVPEKDTKEARELGSAYSAALSVAVTKISHAR